MEHWWHLDIIAYSECNGPDSANCYLHFGAYRWDHLIRHSSNYSTISLAMSLNPNEMIARSHHQSEKKTFYVKNICICFYSEVFIYCFFFLLHPRVNFQVFCIKKIKRKISPNSVNKRKMVHLNHWILLKWRKGTHSARPNVFLFLNHQYHVVERFNSALVISENRKMMWNCLFVHIWLYL